MLIPTLALTLVYTLTTGLSLIDGKKTTYSERCRNVDGLRKCLMHVFIHLKSTKITEKMIDTLFEQVFEMMRQRMLD